jgi:hypothetical protein
MNPPDSESTVAWRVSSLERALNEEREARRRDVEKLDSEKGDTRELERIAKEIASLREQTASDAKAIRQTLQWFMGIVAMAVIAFAGIVVQLIGAH